MAKWAGNIGFVKSVETSPSIFENQETLKRFTGELISDKRRYTPSSTSMDSDITLSNRIKIVANQFVMENLYTMRFAEYGGVRWTITDADPSTYPDVYITLGGIYNG